MSAYHTFQPDTYLNEYYRVITPDTLEMLRFLVSAFGAAPAGGHVLDFGCGPTLYTAIVAARCAGTIHLSDYSAANRTALDAWLRGKPSAFDWRGFSAAVLEFEGVPTHDAAVATREALVRERVAALLSCDVTTRPPIGQGAAPGLGARAEGYDIVCANLCLEAVARDAVEWGRYLSNLAALLRPGGHLIMTTVRRGRAYPVGAQLFPVAYLDEGDVRTGLLAAGFSQRSLQLHIVDSDHPAHPYHGLILSLAQLDSRCGN